MEAAPLQARFSTQWLNRTEEGQFNHLHDVPPQSGWDDDAGEAGPRSLVEGKQ